MENSRVELVCEDGVDKFAVAFWRKGEDRLITSCQCGLMEPKLCEHKVAALLFLRKSKGEYAFELMRDLSEEKNSLLGDYGFTLDDDIEKKFYFYFKEGKLVMDVLDARIKKLSSPEDWRALAGQLPDSRKVKEQLQTRHKSNYVSDEWGIGYGLVFTSRDQVPDLKVTPVVGKLSVARDRFKSGLKELEDQDVEYLPPVNQNGAQISNILKNIQQVGVQSFLKKNRRKESGFVTDLNKEEFLRAQRYMLSWLKKLVPLMDGKILGELRKNHKVKVNNFTPLKLSSRVPVLSFDLKNDGAFVKLTASISVGGYNQSLLDFNRKNFLFIQQHRFLYLLDNVETAAVFQQFYKEPELKIKRSNTADFYKQLLLPLMRSFELRNQLERETVKLEEEPKKIMYLHELGEYLVLNPYLHYPQGELALFGEEQLWSVDEEGEILEYARDIATETQLKTELKGLHPKFKDQQDYTYLYLDFNQTTTGDWVFYAFEALRKMGFELRGFDELVQFKYNTNKPTINITGGSGLDWFDLTVEIQFGDQVIGLKEIREAINSQENFVRLQDGTIGLLPADWIERNSVVLKLGEANGNSLKVSQLHFSLVDALFENIEEGELYLELQEKKRALQTFEKVETQKVPSNLKGTLRDYQKHAFNWMCFLDKFSWGGCLADDMGLGKTIQVLAFLLSQVDLRPDSVNLVVVPTTLLFNWQNELAKFAPSIKYHIHRGPDRDKTSDNFNEYDLIISSYGILVRDIDMFSQFPFNNVILDESQAIKNPNSKRYKAARLLRARNRFVMTGTPVENNTFDLYAQMNFVNPGLLGSMNFFKEEFSNPIDRDGNSAKVEQLKRLIYPFILRRTKEQVAKELPEKTENILFCKMEKKQRKLYDEVRDHYRENIINRIEKDGLGKSSFFVLEGLLKLRQICDSPQLLGAANEADIMDSVKIDTLMSQIQEKRANHKILVFSQFVGMLTLIRKKLDEQAIDYEYLDGTTKDREKHVQRFQEDADCRVFLISLRAGGVGINLTEADYVFLIDPWWNPAVEAQAIDRTHRIGQSKKVFSYKLICEDTIEEKVLKLQERKKHLVSELITTEKSFFKHLRKEDIRELFE
ncbi:SNF2-related protein [Chitinophagales bacterium]|nr:SNF2-related protein [Chitinophagales bacterium]